MAQENYRYFVDVVCDVCKTPYKVYVKNTRPVVIKMMMYGAKEQNENDTHSAFFYCDKCKKTKEIIYHKSEVECELI